MTVFTTALLDNFNRAAAGGGTAGAVSSTYGWLGATGTEIPAPGTSEYGGVATSGGLGIAGANPNGAQCAGDGGGAQIRSGTWGTTYLDCEFYAFCTCGNGNIGGNQVPWALYARAQNPGASTLRVYRFIYYKTFFGGLDFSAKVSRWDGTSETVLASRSSGGFDTNLLVTTDTGFWIGMRCFDWFGFPMVEGWMKTQAMNKWFRMCAARDTSPLAITSAGYPGIQTGKVDTSAPLLNFGQFDSFSGGTISTPSSPTMNAESFPAYMAASGSTNFYVSTVAHPGVLPDVLGERIQPMENFHPGNVAGVLPDQLSDDVAQRVTHRGWIGASAGVQGV